MLTYVSSPNSGQRLNSTPGDREVVGLNSTGCAELFSFLCLPLYYLYLISSVSLVRSLTMVHYYCFSFKQNICLAVQLEAKQAGLICTDSAKI